MKQNHNSAFNPWINTDKQNKIKKRRKEYNLTVQYLRYNYFSSRCELASFLISLSNMCIFSICVPSVLQVYMCTYVRKREFVCSLTSCCWSHVQCHTTGAAFNDTELCFYLKISISKLYIHISICDLDHLKYHINVIKQSLNCVIPSVIRNPD